MMTVFMRCLLTLLVLLVAAVTDSYGDFQRCMHNTHSECDCIYTKSYNETLKISCGDSANADCSWFHLINNTFEPIEPMFQNNATNGVILPGNFNPRNYGTFRADYSVGESCHYVVIPDYPDVCYNCTEIIVNGIRRYNNETVYINVGEDLMIEGDIPRVFKVLNFAAWVNNSNSKICTCDEMLISLKCNCSNLITNNSGVYRLHISLEIECTSSNPEWLSNNVIIIVQREQQIITVTFEQEVYNVSENSTVQVVLILSKPLSSNFTLEVLSINGTAFGGVDYVPGPYNVTFPANHTRVLLSVTIIDDKIPEDKKNFTLTINPSSLPRHVNVGNLSQATVTIMDNDDDGDGSTIDGTSIRGMVLLLLLTIILIMI